MNLRFTRFTRRISLSAFDLRRFRAAVAAGLLLLFMCRYSADAQQQPYVIDVIIGLTGVDSFTGSAVWAPGLRAFAKYANQTGGINGRPLKFDIHDDQTTPQISVQLAAQVIAKHPAIMIGGGTTATCAAITTLLADGPVSYCLSPGYAPAHGSYAFASSASLLYIVSTCVRFARLKGYHRLAIINASDASGQASDLALQRNLGLPENRDVKYVVVEHFNATDLSVSAQVQRIKEAHPDAIISFATGTGFSTLLHNLNDAGVSLPMVTTVSNLDPKHMQALTTFAPPALYAPTSAGLYYEQNRTQPGPLHNAIVAFTGGYKDAGEQLVGASPFVWDPAWIIVSALRKLGPEASAKQLRDYIANLHDFAGVNGIYDFRIGDQHGLNESSVAIVQWEPNSSSIKLASKPGGFPL